MSERNQLRVAIATSTRFHMLDLAREIVNAGADVRLYTGLPTVKVDSDLRQHTTTHSFWTLAQQVRMRFLPGEPGRFWANQLYTNFGRWLAGQLRRRPVDVLDALEATGLEAGRIVRQQGGVWLCNRGSCHILTQRDLLIEEHGRWGAPLPDWYFDPALINRCLEEYDSASGVVVPSSFVRRSFLAHGVPDHKVHLCPYGVDLEMFKPVPKEDTKFRVIFVGAQSIQKGVGYLFEAVRPLVKKRLVELWMVGTPLAETRHILDRNADLFIQKGPQTRNALSWFYSQASVLVLPSVQEGLALVQAQALACGVPVISSTHTGAEDLFQEGCEGFIVPVRSAEAIREKIETLLTDPLLREQMSSAALRRVQQLGGWRDYGRRCDELYKRLTSGARPLATATT